LLFTFQITPTRMMTPVLWSSQWGFFQVSILPESLILVREISFRAIAITVCVYFLLLTTPFAELLQVLKKMKFPPLILELLGLMYRLIFVVLATMEELITAQQARLGYQNQRTTWNSLKIVGGELFKKSLINYRQIHLGLTSRGFTGKLQFLSRQNYRSQWRYRLEAIAGYLWLLYLGIKHHGFTV
jgi:cobalt/nickel transport system permease protein